MNKIARLHYITQFINNKDHAILAKEACKGGVDWVQLRMKNVSDEEGRLEALNTLKVCRQNHATLIINDNVNLAKEIKADGVHLGKTDMDPVTARILLGDGFIIGGTANTLEDILALSDARVDYIGLGPFRFTNTKENLSPILGMDGYKELMNECNARGIKIPIIAIGGILPEDIPSLLEIGLYGVAVSSYINKAQDRSFAASQVIEAVNKAALK